MKSYAEIVSEFETTGGATAWFDTFAGKGYVVANGKKGVKFEYATPKLPQAAYIAHLIKQFKSQGADGIGFWHSGNILYVDPVYHIKSKAEALWLAMAHGELEIYDIANDAVIETSSVVRL